MPTDSIRIQTPEGLQPAHRGTLLWRKDFRTGFVHHYGVVVDANTGAVYHIEKDAKGAIRSKLESYETFACGHPVQAQGVAEAVPLELMQARAGEVEGKPYGLLALGGDWNCESVARYVSGGKPSSKQAELALLAAVVAGVIVWLRKKEA